MQQLTYKHSPETNHKVVNFGQLWSRYTAYWPLFLSLLIVAVTGAWLYLRYTTPLYESSARILIKDERKGAEDAKAMESLDPLNTKKIIENEIEILQSRTLMNEVVKNLGLYAPIYQEGKIRSISGYVTSPFKVLVKDVNTLKEAKKVFFKYDKNRALIVVNKNTYPVNTWVSTPFGILKFIPNDRYKGANTDNLYFNLVNLKSVASDILVRLNVTSVNKLSTIVNLKISDEIPERGEDILNALLHTYSTAMLSDKNILASNTLSFVEERLSHVAHELDSIERRAQQFRSNKGVIDIGTQGRLFLENVSSNDQKLSDINMQLAVLNQVENYVRIKDNKGAIVPSTLGLSDPMLPQLLSKLYESELEYDRIKKVEGANYPSVTAMGEQIEKIKPNILENIQSQRKGLEASRNNLTTTNKTYASALNTIPQKEKELVDINREQNIKNDIYTFLLKKKEETALSHASTVSDSRVVDLAESSIAPVSPNRKIIYLASILAALILGMALITANETLNKKVLFRQEIEILSANPIIGEITYEKSKEPIVIREDSRTFIAEQFRKLGIALNFLKISPNKKKILVTSTISGEGKSFVASNLAVTLAVTGKKVVLIELDLNNPSISHHFNIKDNLGIASYLQGETEQEAILKPTEISENLFFIAAGSTPTNPSKLLMNGRIQELLSRLEKEFDYIVIDSAPVALVTDAYILSPYADITLYVVRHNYTPKVLVERIDDNNKISQLQNVAIVFNGIRPRGFGKNTYGYGYGYGYVYNDKQVYGRQA